MQRVPSNTMNYLNEINKIFLVNIQRDCSHYCESSKSDKEFIIAYNIQSNKTALSYDTNEGYRLEIVTRGKNKILNWRFINMYIVPK